MTWLDTLTQMRKSSGLNLDELSEKSGVPKGTLSKITAGITKAPTFETMKNIVHAMGYTLNDLDDGIGFSDVLSQKEREHIKKYLALDERGKEIVDAILDLEYKHTIEAQKEISRQQMAGGNTVSYFYIPEYREPASAGTGQPIGMVYPESIMLIKEPPDGTSFITHVRGDSMEPDFEDGDMIFVHAQNEIRAGQIGVFFMDGEEFIKELGEGELISHNTKYEPISLDENIRCQGLVLGICDESYLEE